MDNVVQMPSKDDRIADDIRSHIEGMKNAECEWRDHAIALCECVAAAKARYPSLQAFGAWWDAQGFNMNSDTRAALVAMGQDMVRAREVLAVTERRSLRLVYEQEFRFRSAAKTPKEHKRVYTSPSRDRAREAVREFIVAGEPVPFTRLQKDLGICQGTLQTAAALERACKEVQEEIQRPPITRDDLSESDQSKLDRAIKAELKKLQDGFHQAVKKEYQQFIARTHADWKRKIEFAERYSDGTRREQFPFSRRQFKELLFFTHPDRQVDSLKERAADIFAVVKAKEDSLVMPEPPRGGPTFPASPEDLMRK